MEKKHACFAGAGYLLTVLFMGSGLLLRFAFGFHFQSVQVQALICVGLVFLAITTVLQFRYNLEKERNQK